MEEGELSAAAEGDLGAHEVTHGAGGEDNDDSLKSPAHSVFPSTMGFTAYVPGQAQTLHLTASWGDYERVTLTDSEDGEVIHEVTTTQTDEAQNQNTHRSHSGTRKASLLDSTTPSSHMLTLMVGIQLWNLCYTHVMYIGGHILCSIYLNVKLAQESFILL